MENATQLAHRLREVILDGKWIAYTNYKEQLSDLNWELATTKVGALNTIAALTYHINYYMAGVLNVLEGGNLEIKDKYSFDHPPIDNEAVWQDLQNQLWSNTEKFVERVLQLSDEQLDAVFVKEEYGTYQRNIEAIIEHSYYHLGQIVLIKKMIIR